MKTNKTLLIAALITTAVAAHAQDDRPTFEDYMKAKKEGFGKYQQQKESDFDAFRRQANAQFAAKMAEAWQMFDMEPPKEDPTVPDPVAPPVRDDEPPMPVMPVKPGGTITPPSPTEPEKPAPRPTPNLPEPPKPNESWFNFNFFNTPCKVRLDNSLKFRLPSIDEKSVAAVWQQLSGEASNALVADCFRLIDEMNLCDWAAISLFKAIGEAWLGKDSNEAVLMQMYLMTQTGFKVRIGRMSNFLVLLVPFDGQVYTMPFYNKNGEAFYNITGKMDDDGCQIFQEDFPNEKTASLRPKMPALAERLSNERTFTSEKYPELSVQVKVNRNLMDFWDTYPHCSHDNLVYAGLSERTKQAVYPVFRKAIEGKPLDQAANMLLNFMHTAFDYMSDLQQFEYERPLFGDESFWFPYNDCEDRAILYCILVRDLLGIDAVLLEYPGHMSTAIALPTEVKGAYMTLEGKRFLLCDPTYIGANIGEIPKSHRNLNPGVIIIN